MHVYKYVVYIYIYISTIIIIICVSIHTYTYTSYTSSTSPARAALWSTALRQIASGGRRAASIPRSARPARARSPTFIILSHYIIYYVIV